ncbi:MAG: enoyl-CoA hydratase [Proteobacteria bacterium]|nr:MAG: enoyl-CoA hydratase [Pseudomonadota bacterium]
MSYENIMLEVVEQGIYRLTINRPKSYNALNAATLDEIHQATQVVAADSEARVLILTGAGDKAFVAGADIKEMQNFTGIEGQRFSEKGMQAFRALELLDVPVIAAVNGFCLGGGCELAMSCDWIIAAENAVFGQPEVNLGVTPGFGGSQRLSRLIGRARAMELLVTGNSIKAAQAERWGLANHVYPATELMDEVLTLARTIRQKGPLAVSMTKRLVQRGQDMELDTACVMESQAFGLSFSTDDQKEGMKAFVEKRDAEFSGR